MSFRHASLLLVALLLLVSAHPAHAQRGKPVKRMLSGMVFDAATERPLSRAEVRSVRYSRKTGTAGEFTLDIVRGEDLVVSSVGYHSRRIPYNRFKGQDTLKIYLTPNTSLLGNVYRAPKSETVHQKKFESVLDFVFLRDTLVVLSFMDVKVSTLHTPETYFHNSLSFYRYGTELHRLILPDAVRGLYLDPFNQLWALGLDFVFKVKRSESGPSLEPIDVEFFNTKVSPITALGPSGVFYSEVLPIVPQVAYRVYVKESKETFPVRFIRNQEYFRNAPGDFRMLGPNGKKRAQALEDEHKINKVYFAPYLRNEMDEDAPPIRYPDAQAFPVGDRLVIFDVLNGWIYHHDHLGYPVDSLQMYHHNFEGEKYRGMLQDTYTGEVYAVHMKGGAAYLRRVSPWSGGAGMPVRLHNNFPFKIRIHQGWAYYTCREPDSKQHRKLVREKLP